MKRCLLILVGVLLVLLVAPAASIAAPGGSISGVVTAAAGGQAIAGIEVCAVELTTNGTEGCSSTSSSGTYTIGGLPEGGYEVFFFDPEGSSLDYIAQTYAQTVTVGSGTNTAGIDASLAHGARVTGTVRGGSPSSPVEGIEVCLYVPESIAESEFWFPQFCSFTGVDGSYTIVGAAAGEYRVGFEPPYESSLNLLPQYWSGKSTFAEAEALHLAVGTTTSGIDATLAAGGQVSGRVTSAVSGTGLAGIEVCARPNQEGSGNCALSEAGGGYAIPGLPTGSYRVEFSTPGESSLNYVRQFFHGATSESQAEAVAVTAGATTSSIDAAMHPGGTLGGKVIAATGKAPLAGIEVCADGEETFRCAQTGAGGEYTINSLSAGEYTVRFSTESDELAPQYYEGGLFFSEAKTVTVAAAGSTTGIDAEMRAAAKITGTVTSAPGGAPLEGVRVCRYAVEEEFESSCSYTDAQGHYTLSGLLGTGYKLEFSSTRNFLRQYYQGKGSLAEAETLNLTAGQTRSGVDVALQPGGQIQGRVTAATGGGAAVGVRVTAYTGSGSEVTSTTTDANGEYSIVGLTSGRYKVGFGGNGNNLISQYYEAKATLGQAAEIAVTAGSAKSGIDAALQTGGELTGKVTSVGGTALASANVFVIGSGGGQVASAQTNSHGEYTIKGLGEGSYRVGFSRYGFETQYYDGQANFAAAEAVAVTVGVRTEGIGATLHPLASMSGTVTDATSHGGVDDVEVCAYLQGGDSFGNCAPTNGSGHYTLSLPQAGSYKVAFYPEGGYLDQYYDGRASLEEADEITVASGDQITAIDAALQSGGHVKGKVTAAAGGAALGGIDVCAEPAGGGGRRCVTSEANGEYDIGDLETGSYEIEFWPPEDGSGGNYLTQFYDGKAASSEADPIAVVAGSTKGGVDAALQAGGEIRGTVTSVGSNSPLGDARACAFEPSGSSFRCVDTDSQGRYAIEGLAGGEYVVYFFEEGGNGAVSYYDGVSGQAEATPVDVATGSVITGIDGRLHADGRIVGQVTSAATDSDLSGIEVCALDPEGFVQSCATSVVGGGYSLAVPSGSFKVEFRSFSQSYETQYYDGVPTVGEAGLVEVAEGGTAEGIDAAMISPGQISGRVSAEGSGSGLEGIDVCAFPTEGFSSSHCAISGANGEYTIANVPSATYKVSFSAPSGMDYLRQYYPGKAEYDEAPTVTTSAGTVIGNVDATMQVGGEIKGRVTAAGSGNPIAGIEVCASAVGSGGPSGASGCPTTDSSGHYTLEQLPTGEVKVGFAPGFNSGLNFVHQYYDGRAHLAEAQAISIVRGETREGIDAALGAGGEVSGKVIRIGTKAPLQGVDVCPYETSGFEAAGACAASAANGEYTLRGLPAGQVKVEFFLNEYFTRWYKETAEESSALAVPVEVLHDTTGIDAALRSTHPLVPGSISPPTVSGTAKQGATLTEHHGSWTNEPDEYVYRWLRCDELGDDCQTIPGAAGQTYVPVADDVGHTIVVEEEALNLEGESLPATASPTAVVIPAPPTNLSSPGIEGFARAGETLTETHGGWTNEPTAFTYQWERCEGKGSGCDPIADATAASYELTTTDVGHTVRVLESAENAGGQSEAAVSTASAVVVPEPPVASAPPKITGSAIQGKTLTEHHGTWSGNPTDYGYQWARCSSGGDCEPINGANETTYVPVAADVGDTIDVIEVAVNAGGEGQPSFSALTAVVVAAAPVSTSPPTIGGQARDGGNLTESHGTWTNQPTGYAYQWERCSGTGTSCSPIGGATEATYSPEAADVGHRLVVEEVASNDGGAGKGVTSAPSAVVVEGVPVDLTAPRIEGTAEQGETLTEAHGGWTNEPSSYAVEWQRCDAAGENCAGVESGSELTLTAADIGHTIRMVETASNAGGAGEPARSEATARVVAVAPVNVGAPTISGPAVEGETLTESHGNWTNEPSSYAYRWERCSAAATECQPIAAAEEAHYVLIGADVGHRLVVVETAKNAGGSGTPKASEPTDVVATAVPVNTAPPTIAGTVRVGATLTEEHGTWTNAPSSYAYRWERCDGGNCETIGGATQPTYTPSAADLGRRLVVVETATNHAGQGAPASSAPVGPVAPEPPVDVSPPSLVGTAETGETLIVKAGDWSNGVAEFREQWLRCDAAGANCAPIQFATGFAYTAVLADVGHTLKVREVGVNAGGEGSPVDSAATATVVVAPLRAVAGEDLRGVVGTPLTFDGSGSSPSGEITASHWDFGDGSGAGTVIAQHTYTVPGDYTATLTVHRGGEVAERSIDVTVAPPAAPSATITVTDEGGHPVAGAEVLYLGSGGTRIDARTDGSGEAQLAGLPDGTDTVLAQASGFRPVAGQVTVAGGEGEATIALTRGALAEAKLTSRELTLAEIEAAGIDPRDPANQQTYGFEIHLHFDGEGGGGTVLACYINSAGEFVGSCGGGGLTCSRQACSSGSVTLYGGSIEGHPFIQELSMSGKATALKQFFEIGLSVYNVSPEPFKFTHGQASLTVPAGMSLAPTSAPQAAEQSVADIPGEGSARVSWIVRGDQPGEYTFSATYGAQLEPFEAPFEVQASLATPLKVWGAEAFGLQVKAESGSLREGQPYHVRIGVVDEADIPFYNVAIGINPAAGDFIFQPGQKLEAGVAELKPGEVVFAPEDIEVPDADGGTFDPSRSFARFAGEGINAGQGIEAVAPAPLYALSASLSSATLVHLHWQPSPGAEGYEVFSTQNLDTPFEASPDAVRASASSSSTVTGLGAEATDAYIPRGAGDPPRFYAVATVIGGRLRLEHPVREPSIQGPLGGPLTLRELLAGGRNPSEFCLQCAMDRIEHADPVDGPTGNFWHSFTDLSVPGRGLPLDLERTYNSQAAVADGPFGHGWSFSYGIALAFPDASEVVVEQEDGSAVVFTEEPDGSFSAPPRVTATLVHENDGSWVFTRHRRETFTFDSAGRLTRETDLNGYATSLAYGGGHLESVTDPAGRKLTFAWQGGHVASVIDPLGRKVEYAYDGAGDLTDVTDGGGGDTHFTYDGAHRMLTMRTPDQAPGVPGSTGKTVTNVYDGQGRVVEQSDQLGRTTDFAYEGEPLGETGGTVTVTDPEGHVTRQSYRYGELVAETQGYGTAAAATWTFAYDQGTLGLAEVTDPNGHTTKSTYDAEGNLLSSEDALGRRTVDTYDGLNDLLTSTDPLGVTTTNQYDGDGNLLETSRPLAGTAEVQSTSYAYGDGAHPGDVTATTDPDGKTWHYAYDADGDLTSTTDPLGNQATATYDAIGRRLTSTAPRGNAAGADPAEFTTHYVYDAFGQVRETTDPLGHVTKAEYDPDQNLIASADADGHVTHYEYDAADERVAERRADGSTLRTTYAPDGGVKEQIDAAGHATHYAYDALGRLATTTDPLGRTTHYGYDGAGNETSMTDPEGGVTTKAYDAADELTSIDYSDGKTPDVTGITYDADGERTGQEDGTGTWSWTWDSLHRLRSATEGGNGTVGYGYDLDGNLLALTYPNGRTVSHEFDAADRLTAVTDWLGNTTRFGYDPDSDLSEASYPGGVTTQVGHDAADRLASIADANGGGPIASFDYTRDPVGQVTEEAVDNGEAGSRTYSYDTLDQLTGASGEPYAYDAGDNPTGFGMGTTQSFDAADQLTGRSEPGGETEPGDGTGAGEPGGGGSGSPAGQTGGGGTGTGTQGGPPASGGEKSVTPPPPAKRAIVHAVSSSGSLQSPSLQTHGAGELVVAFVAAAGPSKGGQRVAQLSGGSLHWSPVARQAGPGGDAEIWQARTKKGGAGQVAVRMADSGYQATLVVETYAASASVKSHGIQHGHGSAPSISLPGAAGDTTIGVGASSGQKGGVTPSAGQQLLAKFASGGAAGWVQQGSSSGRVGDSHPATDWGMAAVAIGAKGASADAAVRSPSAGAGPSLTAQLPATPHAGGSGTLSRHYTYDARGDRTGESAGSATLALGYDQANRLTTVGTEATYAYDGDGLRMSKTVKGATTAFAWSEAEELPQLLQAGGASYVYGPEGTPIEQISGGVAVFLHQDQQGSTRVLTDDTGEVVGRYDYTPWGAVAKHTGTATTALQFDGQYTDAETGFQYLRARYYDPKTGQFLTRDPAIASTRSSFGFASNNPLNLADPLGLFSWSHAFKVAGLVTGGAAVLAAGCVLTLCTADVAAVVGGAGLAAATASVSIDTGFAVYNCDGGGDRNDCVSSSVGAGIGVVSLGAGGIAGIAFKGISRAVDFGGDSLSLGYDEFTYGGGRYGDGAGSQGRGGMYACTPAPINIQGGGPIHLQGGAVSVQPASGGAQLQ